MKQKKEKAFTIMEVVIVLFLIATLSTISALGFSKASRQKKIDEAGRTIRSGLGLVRDYALFGQTVSTTGGDIMPCGYALSVGKDQNLSTGLYTSTPGLDRISVMDIDKTCDQVMQEKTFALTDLKLDNQTWNSSVKVDSLVRDSVPYDCVAFLFSAPRGGSYYCASLTSKCPPTNGSFSGGDFVCHRFSDTDNKPFEITLKSDDKLLADSTKWRVYASGNIEEIITP